VPGVEVYECPFRRGEIFLSAAGGGIGNLFFKQATQHLSTFI
jgi:hypothetical protein